MFCLVLLCFSGIAWIPGSVTIRGKKYRDIGGIASHYRMRTTKSGKMVQYAGAGRKLLLELSSRKMRWNGISVLLGHPVIQQGNKVYISDSDWNSTVKILFSPGYVQRHPVRIITLDAGHGGSDQGAAGKISKEKDITLRVTRRVAAILRRFQYQVHLTRSRDVTLPLKSRSALQRVRRSDLFVSIHVNATVDKKVTGIETFCLTPADAPSSHGKSEFVRNYSNRFDINNFALAWKFQNALLRRTGALDRGIKRARFAVLKDISAPGVLVEIGFISNSWEERRLNDPNYIEKIARGIAEGIISYHYGLPKKSRR